MKNRKGFTLIELLAVIVVLGIIMLIAITSVSGVLEKSRKDAFVATARAYISAVRLQLTTNNTLPACGSSSTVYLASSMVEKGGITSPYNAAYNLAATAGTSSMVIVAASAAPTCAYTYSIYLFDANNNRIGTFASPIAENSLSSTSVTTA